MSITFSRAVLNSSAKFEKVLVTSIKVVENYENQAKKLISYDYVQLFRNEPRSLNAPLVEICDSKPTAKFSIFGLESAPNRLQNKRLPASLFHKLGQIILFLLVLGTAFNEFLDDMF